MGRGRGGYKYARGKRVSYRDYMHSRKWQAKRAARLACDDASVCWCCGVLLSDLPAVDTHVHHRTYRNFGDEPLSDLVVTCALCNIERIEIVLAAIKDYKPIKSWRKRWVATDYVRREYNFLSPVGPDSMLSDDEYLALKEWLEAEC